MAKNDSFRFCVGNPETKHSSVWLATCRKNDLYFGARSAMGKIKISFHESGIGRVSLTKEYYDQLSARRDQIKKDRKFNSWKSPDVPDTGRIQVASLIFPVSFLNSIPLQKADIKKETLFVDYEVGAQAVEFGIFYSKESPQKLESKFLKISRPLIYFSLPDGQYVSIVTRLTDFDAEKSKKQFLEKTKVGSFHDLSLDTIAADEQHSNLSAFLWNNPTEEKGHIFRLWEIHGLSLKKKRNV